MEKNEKEEKNRRESELEGEWEEEGRAAGFLQSPLLTKILLGLIAVMAFAILALLLPQALFGRREAAQEADSQPAIAKNESEEETEPPVITVEDAPPPQVETEQEETSEKKPAQEEAPEKSALTSADDGKTAVVVDVEDESNEAYTKEFILKEAYPHFAENNQAAIWDLAHLKRYVKLSEGLRGSGEFYYRGDVDAAGKPDGKGLAIYEKNSYYYGQWSHGKRSGTGAWFRFYINQKNKANAFGAYVSHSYSGQWADNLPNGEGAEHFEVDISRIPADKKQIVQNVVGRFVNGLYDGDMYATTVNRIGTVQEWYAVAQIGVFDLWRDMSAIGECSVWRLKEDASVCMDIDKSENQNQGLRELLQ